MPLYGQFSGARSYGRGTASRPLPPVVSNVSDVGLNRPYDNGAIQFTVTPNASGPVPTLYNAWAVDPQNNEIPSGSFVGPTVTISGLKSNTQYTLKVVAIKGSLVSNFTNFTTPTLITTVPQSPTIGTATDVGVGRSIDNAAATVSFTPRASGGKTQTYKVYTSDGTERGSGSGSPLTASGINTASNNSYAFNVKAINANGESQVSGNTSTITLTTIPGAPSLTLDSTSGTTVNFSFSAPSNTGGKAITSTRIFVMSGGGSELATTTISAASGTGSLNIPELTDNDAFLRGEATNANGTGAVGAASTIIQRSGTPTLSTSRSNIQNATVTITNYNASVTYSVSTTSGSAVRSGSTITVSGISTTSAFNVTVTANQGAFYINRSATISVPSSTTPGPINNIQVTSYGMGIISIAWDAIAGTGSYRTVLTGAGGDTVIDPGNGVSFDGLTEGGTYSVTITAFSGAGATGTTLASGSLNNFTVGSAPTTTTTTTTLAPATTTTTTTLAPGTTTTTTTTTAAPTCSGTCNAGTVGNTTNCDAATGSCTPAGCGAGCTVTCTNYCSSAASSPGQSVTATGPCGSYTVTASFPGARAVIRCCSC